MRIFKQLTLSILLVFSSLILQAEDAVEEIEPFSEAELEQILAPIALYPDTVLSHILIAATYPLEVVQAERWTIDNPDYEGSDAVEAVNDKDWDPSVKALAAFPQLLKRLSENLEWTQKLGDAFLQDEEKLLASVQSLRQRAYEAGNLDKMDKVSITHEDDNSIVIEPVEKEIVYVPYYDTRVIYGSWYWSHYPPVYWHVPHYATRYYDHHTPFYWGPRIHVSFGFFFSSFHWHNHHLIRIHRDHYRPRHYYTRHQIVNHQHVRRWSHNPTHRRGVSYRSVTVRNRYSSDRLSQTEIRSHRKDGKGSIRNSNRINDSRVTTSRTKDGRTGKNRTNTSNTRIATPDRIREELKDGRISVKERNARPTNRETSNQNRNSRDVKGNKTPRTNRTETSSSNRNKNPKSSTRTTPPVRNDSSGRSNRSKERAAPSKQPAAPRKDNGSKSPSRSAEPRSSQTRSSQPSSSQPRSSQPKPSQPSTSQPRYSEPKSSSSSSSRNSSSRSSSSRSSSGSRSSGSSNNGRSSGSRSKKH